MSFSGDAQSFFGPLAGKTVTLLVPGRSADLAFGRAAISLLARSGDACAVLDLDALYSSNSDKVFSGLPAEWKKERATIRVPEPDSRIEAELPGAFAAEANVLIVDSLNTLNHLLAADDGSSRSRKLSFTVAGLSYIARTEKKVVLFTMYRREGFGRLGIRSISGLSDVTASVGVRGSELSFSCERGVAWPGGTTSIRIP
jgi:hypothetical protein